MLSEQKTSIHQSINQDRQKRKAKKNWEGRSKQGTNSKERRIEEEIKEGGQKRMGRRCWKESQDMKYDENKSRKRRTAKKSTGGSHLKNMNKWHKTERNRKSGGKVQL